MYDRDVYLPHGAIIAANEELSRAFHIGVFSISVITLYAGAAFAAWRRLHGSIVPTAPVAGIPPTIGILGVLALIAHGVLLYVSTSLTGGLNIALGNALSLISWISVLGILVLARRYPQTDLGVVVLPIAAAAVFSAWLWPGREYPVHGDSLAAITHLVAGVVAFGLLALAIAQALFLDMRERQIREHRPGLTDTGLPLETMDALLFRLLWGGFLLLTLTLLTGFLFSEDLYGKAIPFKHHVILSFFAWISFGALLAGRALYGWRGRRAAVWASLGFVILVLAYFGSRFVLEVILNE